MILGGAQQIEGLCSSACIQVTSAPTASLIVKSLSFSPTNEGEYGTFSFQLQPNIQINQAQNQAIVILFPAQFAKALIPYDVSVYCTSAPTSSPCTIAPDRRVQFAVFDQAVSAGDFLYLTVFGVVNPAVGLTDQFIFYLVDFDKMQVMAYTETGGKVTITAAPSVLPLRMVNATDPRVGAQSDYMVQFDSGALAMPALGALWLDWPEIYQSLFVSPFVECASSISGAVPSCQFLNNSGMRRLEISNSGSFQAGATNLQLTFKSIPNPRVGGTTAPFSLRLVDLSTKQVLSRSFQTLNPNATVTIQASTTNMQLMNLTKAVVVRGTFSDPFVVQLGIPAYDSLVVTPSTSTPGVKFLPDKLEFHFAWNNEASFRAGAGLDVAAGIYVMDFIKSEQGSSRYSSLSSMNLIVVDPSASIRISIDAIPDLPIRITSLPINVKLDKPALNSVKINIKIEDPVQSQAVQFSTSLLEFSAGDSWKNFTITPSEAAVSGFVQLELWGEGSTAYYLSTKRLSFNLQPTTRVIPEILSVRVQKTTRTTATLRISLASTGKVHYMVSYKGTEQPSVEQLVANRRMHSSAPQLFGTAYTSATLRVTDFSVSGLRDDTWYVAYTVGENTSGEYSKAVAKAVFKTAQSLKPAQFSVRTIKLVGLVDLILALARTLGLPEGLFSLIGPDPTSLYSSNYTGRALQDSSSSNPIIYQMALSMDREQDGDLPIRYVTQLDNRMDILQSYLPDIDPSQSIATSAQEFSYAAPVWAEGPKLVNSSDGNLTISASIPMEGTLYGIVVEVDGAKPLSQQIVLGLDASNNNVTAGRFARKSCIYRTPAPLTFTGLGVGGAYQVWLTAENSLPGTPGLMDDSRVQGLNISSTLTSNVTKGLLVMMGDSSASALVLGFLLGL